MKNLLLLFLCFLTVFAVKGQIPTAISNSWRFNGNVNKIVEDANHYYIGGSFTNVYKSNQYAYPITCAAVFDTLGVGSVQPNLPSITGTRVRNIISDNNGGWFLAGQFTAADGITRNNIVHIKNDSKVDIVFNADANGIIHKMLLSGNDLYVAGEFTSIKGVFRNRIAKINSITGDVDPSFNPNANGIVYALELMGTNLYLGGSFTQIGTTTRNRIAMVNSNTGAVDGFFNPSADADVFALRLGNSTLYVGGSFTNIGGQPRNRIARINFSSGSASGIVFNPNVANQSVTNIELSGNTIIFSGSFTTVSAVTRNRIAKVHFETGALLSWAPNVNSQVNSIAVRGGNVYLAGGFTTVNSTARNRVCAVDTATGALKSWYPETQTGAMFAIAASGDKIYVGGDQTFFGGLPFPRLLRLNKSDLSLDLNWKPNPNNVINDILIDGNDLYIAGTFTQVGGVAAGRVAKIQKTGAGNVDASFNVNANSAVNTISKSGSQLFFGGSFSTVNSTLRSRIAMVDASTGALQSWNPGANEVVNSIKATSNGLYVGGNFTQISGLAKSYLVKFKPNFDLDTNWACTVNALLYGIVPHNGNLYLGGDFSQVNGTARTWAARVSEAGVLDQNWNTTINFPAGDFAIDTQNGSVYVAGFHSGVTANSNLGYLTKHNLTTGAPDLTWATGLNARAVTVLLSNNQILTGGLFTTSTAINPLDRFAVFSCSSILPLGFQLSSGTIGTAYSQSVTASGLTGSLTWAVQSGSLPAGLTLNPSTGQISGTPTSAGTFDFTVSVSGTNCTLSKEYRIGVNCATTSLSPASLGTLSSGVPVNTTIAPTIGTASVFRILSGSIPAGLTLDTLTGLISGIPTQIGNYSFNLGLVLSSGCFASSFYSGTINCGTPGILPTSFPSGTVDSILNLQLTTTSFALPATWSVSSGTLPPGLTLNTSTGVISGTYTAPVLSTFTVTANNGFCNVNRVYSNVAVCNNIVISPSTLPNGRVSTAWVHNMTQTGLTGAVQWTVVSGSLPTGTTLNLNTGVLGGTPSTAGTFNFTIRATGGPSCIKEQSYSVVICPNGSVLPVSVANGTENTSFSQQFTQSAITGTITWSVSNGTLPSGLTLNPSTGLLSGTPTATGVFNITIQANNGTCTVDRNYTLRICPQVTLGNLPVPNPTVGVPFSHTLTQTGLSGTVTWSMVAAQGLSMNSTGTISGTPGVSTSVTTSVTVTDGSCSHVQSVTFFICNPVVVNPTTLPATTVGATYNQTLTASGVAGPYTWSVSSGSFPPGLNLSSSTGVISGTPNTAGNYSFTIGVSAGGNACPGSRNYSINVACGTTSITPVTLANGNIGSAYSAQLNGNGLPSTGTTWSISSGSLPLGLSLNTNTGEISGTPTAAGASSFTVSATGGGCSASQALSITICPAISVSPSSVTQCEGTSATLNVTVSGTGPFSYQWKRNSVNLPGATNSDLILNNLQAGNAGSYAVDVTSSCGTSTSTSIVVSVNQATSITTQPTAQSLCLGANANFSVSATGTGSLSYQWKKGGINIPGATNPSFAINNLLASDAGNYTVEVSGSCGTVTSNIAAITINTATAITTQPSALTQCAATNATFSVVGTGTGTLSYQWKKAGNVIPGATNSSYTINNISAADAGNFTVDVTGTCGTVVSNTASLTVNPTTVISTQPVAVTQCAGTNATFSVSATGTGTLSYQWKKAGVNIPGATISTLTLNNIVATDAADYSVDVTSSCGTVTSNSVALTVQPATSITNQPVPSTTCVGGSVTFTVAAIGQGTLSYQWKKGGSNIPGATASSYTLNNVTLADAGNFTVEIAGACGTVLSNSVSLTVNTSTAINTQPAALTQCAGTNANFSVSAAGAGTLTYQWKKGGVNIPGATSASYTITGITVADAGNYSVEVTSTCGTTLSNNAALVVNPVTVITTQPQSQTLCAGANASFTVAATGTGTISYQWKKASANIPGATLATLNLNGISSVDAAAYSVDVTSSCGTVTSLSATLALNAPTSITTQPVALIQCAGTNASFSVVATGTGTLSYQWKKAGSNVTGATNASLTINNISALDAGNYTVDVTGLCGTVVSSTASLTVNPITTITTQPAAVTQCAGTNATFSVVGAGTGTLTYQWRKAGVNIPGATNAGYTLNNIAAADAANYSVVVTGTCGNVTSANAALTVNPITVINTQPQPLTQCLGTNAAFTVSASGTGTLTYQWKKGGVNIPAATNATLTLNNILAGDAANYSVEVTGTCGTVTSNNAALNINNPVTISTQPLAVTQCAGTNASFTVTATGTGSLTYQWRKAGVSIPGATNASYTLNNITAADAALYSVNVTNVCGTVTSANASLTVNPLTTITTQPQSQTLCTGLIANFSVAAAGTGTLTYQWRRDGNNITGATNANLAIGPVAVVDAGNYTVVVTGACGSVTSQIAALTINQPVTITAQGQPQSATQCEGTNVLFSVNATGSGTLAFQWQKAGVNIPGATQSSLTLNGITATDAAAYTVVVTNICNSVTSSSAQLTVNPLTQIVVQPVNTIACEGGSVMLTVGATGTGNLAYQWQKDNLILQGETNDTLVINSAQLSDLGAYHLVATGLCGSLSTDTISLIVNPVYTENDQAVICNGTQFVFGSQTLTTAGVYTETFQTINGCDSVVILTLSVNPVFNSTDSVAICSGDTYSFGSQTLSVSGIYTEVFASITGCDSTVVLTLHVIDIANLVTVNQYTLSVPNVTGAVYQWIDCNTNLPIPGAVNNEYTATENGRYKVQINFNGCEKESDCIEVTGIGIDQLSNEGIKVYPNPTRNFVNISGRFDISGITVVNQYGVSVMDVRVEGTQQQISLEHLPAGVYHIIVLSGNKRFNERIVIQ